jgi:hypothetical protein
MEKDALEAAMRAVNEAQKSLVQTHQLLLQEVEEMKKTHEELKADKDLIESFISGMDSLTERENLQIEALVKLYKLQSQERQQQAQAHG